MLEMPIRTGRRLQDAARHVQENISRRTGERQQITSLHRQRMTCSGSVRSFANTQDWTNGMSMSPSGRFRVVEEAVPRRKFFSREGIRWDAAWLALAAVAFLCVAVLLADVAGSGLYSRSITRLERKIEDLTAKNEKQQEKLALSSGDVSVCTEAVKLNLISGNGAQTIILTVPQAATAGTAFTEAYSANAGWTSGGAGD